MIAQRFLLCTFEYLREIENIFKKWLAYDYSRWVSIMKVNEGQKLCCNVFLNCFCCCCCKSKYSRKSCKYQFGTKLSLCPPPPPQDHPIMDYNCTADDRDVESLVRGIQLVLRIGNSPAFRRFGARFHKQPFPLCKHLELWSHAYWQCYVR